MTANGLHAFLDRDDLIAALTEICANSIGEAVARRGRATVALSGGSTPAPLYRALSHRPLPWGLVTLALVDERWVAPDHEASNERLVRESCAAAIAEGAALAPMRTPDAAPAEAIPEVEARYRPLRPFDLVVLGLGTDGHTASWFPRSGGLAQALDPPGGATVAAVLATGSPVAGAYVERMTLTRPAIAEARTAALMITGADKRAAYETALAPGPEEDAPVRALLRRPGAPAVYWAP